jgi:hypothetical protein
MAKRTFQPDRYIQIDAKRQEGTFVICGMYTGVQYVRDGKTIDSAGVLNTTETYTLEAN